MDIEQFRTFCLSLPGATEDIKWENDLCFSVGQKMFFVWGMGTDFGVSYKVRPEDFEALTDTPGIIPAPYLARAKWVKVTRAERFSPPEWEEQIRTSYELVKSKLPQKLQRQLEENSHDI